MLIEARPAPENETESSVCHAFCVGVFHDQSSLPEIVCLVCVCVCVYVSTCVRACACVCVIISFSLPFISGFLNFLWSVGPDFLVASLPN